jgi:hypothetical protein
MGSTLEQRNGWRDGEVLGHMGKERGERKRGREREREKEREREYVFLCRKTSAFGSSLMCFFSTSSSILFNYSKHVSVTHRGRGFPMEELLANDNATYSTYSMSL